VSLIQSTSNQQRNDRDIKLMKPLRIALLLVAVCAMQGCDQESPTAPTSGASFTSPPDWVNVTAITPARNTRLSAGTGVSIDVTVSYALTTADAARLVLIIQNQAQRSLQDPGEVPVRLVSRGVGTMSLSSRVELPVDGIAAVHVFVALFNDNAATSYAVDEVSYPVL
jgi:hypothetical protein